MTFRDWCIVVGSIIVLVAFIVELVRTWPTPSPPVWAHGRVVGHVTSISEDEKGLYITFQVDDDPTMKMLQGDMKGLSLGLMEVGVGTDLHYNEIRYVRDPEVNVVNFPPRATAFLPKGPFDAPTKKEEE